MSYSEEHPVFDAVTEFTTYLNANNLLDPELTLALRLMKVQEEAGEVAEAALGLWRQNPRKSGVLKQKEDVATELCDVIFTAMVAISSMGLSPRMWLALRTQHIMDRIKP